MSGQSEMSPGDFCMLTDRIGTISARRVLFLHVFELLNRLAGRYQRELFYIVSMQTFFFRVQGYT